MQNVEIKDQSPHCSKHVLPAVPTSEVYLEDCVKALKRFNDKHFDLAIVDPPYGIGIDGQKKSINLNNPKANRKEHKFKGWDNEIPTAEYFDELWRVSKNQIVWGANHFISKMPFDSSCWLVWDKDNSGNFADCEMAWTNCKVPAKVYKKLHISVDDKNKIHPTQKPIKLYDWIYANYAKEGDLILDTHLGSGSSRIAAYKGGFNFVGFEIDKDYYEAQEKRFKDFVSQLRMF